jgi:hypothetical protein
MLDGATPQFHHLRPLGGTTRIGFDDIGFKQT